MQDGLSLIPGFPHKNRRRESAPQNGHMNSMTQTPSFTCHKYTILINKLVSALTHGFPALLQHQAFLLPGIMGGREVGFDGEDGWVIFQKDGGPQTTKK